MVFLSGILLVYISWYVKAYLEKIESENLSPFQVFPYEFSVEKEHRNVTVPASVLKKLDEAEKSYLK